MARISRNGDRKGGKRKREEEGASSRESDPLTRKLDDAGKSSQEMAAEGRRCALCGEAKESPEALAAEKLNPDSTVGRSGLGRLLGPLSDRMGVAALWVHQECAVWSPEVYFLGVGCLKNVKAALRRGRFLKCSLCGQPGATIGCRVSQCPRTYHLPCARVSGCSFNHKRYLMSCAEHVSLFLLQDKKRLRECMIGAWDDPKKPLKDQRREEPTKTLENLEDDEFLKRERKRLQRDLARLAPVKVGGPSSSPSSSIPFEGWDSIGGLQNVVQCLKEMVTLPLLYPEMFQKLGIVPPRGVLLHGYPGTGKTHVVRALLGACSRGEQQIAYFARKGADCLGKYVGDSERQLRLLFQLAEQAQPSIIFFDELDGLAPKRSRSQDQTLSSVVSTLLALMDGLNPRGSVVVIGATNRPDALDPALRRAGRFDREIFFPLPSTAEREAILRIHTRSWKAPPSPELLSAISRSTVGYAGADLQAVCAQAAMVALRRAARLHSPGADSLPEIQVQIRDWMAALAQSGPPCSRRMIGSALSEVQIAPLPSYLVPALLRPVLTLFLHLDSDGRFFLPAQLRKPLAQAKEVLQRPGSSGGDGVDLERACRGTGIFSDDASRGDGEDDESLRLRPLVKGWKAESFRILLRGAARDGKSLVAASALHVLQSSLQVFVLSIQTMIQAGSGELVEGLMRILESAKAISSVVFMPRIESWALEKTTVEEEDVLVSSVVWRTFLQQTSSLPSHLPVLFLATCEENELPLDVSSFFCSSSSAGAAAMASYSSHACVQVPAPTENDVLEVFKRAAKAFISAQAARAKESERSTAEPVAGFEIPKAPPTQPSVSSSAGLPQEAAPERSALLDAVRSCGYQLLNSPHFFLFRQTTARLQSGPSLYLENPYTGLWIIKDPPPPAAEAQGSKNEPGEAPKNEEMKVDEPENPKTAATELETGHEDALSKRLLEALGPEDEELKDENRRVWGLEAVGLKALKGFYKTGAELVSELKMVLELLRQRLESKSRARRRRWHRCQLLTQAGALQDLMECWLHELRRLENREKVLPQTKAQPSDHVPVPMREEVRPEEGEKVPEPRQSCEAPSLMLSYVEVLNMLLSSWEKQGRSLMVEDLHDIVSETSAELFSRLRSP